MASGGQESGATRPMAEPPTTQLDDTANAQGSPAMASDQQTPSAVQNTQPGSQDTATQPVANQSHADTQGTPQAANQSHTDTKDSQQAANGSHTDTRVGTPAAATQGTATKGTPNPSQPNPVPKPHPPSTPAPPDRARRKPKPKARQSNMEEKTRTVSKTQSQKTDGTTGNVGGSSKADPAPGDELVLRKVVDGSCQFNELPPQSKNVVRIFVSSTFSDTKEERNAFMQNVYPKLAEMCREKYGLEFQVVDMRWGVPEQASHNHSTTELCLSEINKCQEVSAGPNFVAILGNKYGYRPIPNEIRQEEFEVLQSAGQGAGDERWNTVTDWFRLDINGQPPVYLLQPINTKLPHYNSNDPELRKSAQNEWNTTDQTLTQCLRDTAAHAHNTNIISEEQKHRYFMSVTENEVTHGILESKRDPKTSCVCIIREIPNIKSHLQATKAPKFIDIDPTQRDIDGAAETFLKNLRDSKIREKLPEYSLTQVEIDWDASGANVSLDALPSQEGNASEYGSILAQQQSNVLKHRKYLDKLCDEYLQKLRTLISAAGDTQQKLYDELNTEVLQHWHFAKVRCEIFEGREEVLREATKQISMKMHSPVVIYGQSGCGKTSVIAKVVQLVTAAIKSKGDQIKPYLFFFRFLGTTPFTSNIQQVLTNLCKQISLVCNVKWVEPDKYIDLVTSFHSLLENVSKKYKLLIILDSIDQLLPVYDAYKMEWLPNRLPNNIRVVVSVLDEGYTIVDTLKERYQGSYSNFIEIKPLEQDVSLRIVQKWLQKECRVMTATQEKVVKQALSMCGLPLYARIMFDQVRRWKSYEEYTLSQLETSVQGAIKKLYEQMEEKFGLQLVKHCLSYLTSSRYGLSEVELEHMMSLDDTLLNTVFKFWRPPIRRIPALLWTRIRNEINSYIVERSADGILVIYWYHRQFIAATTERYLTESAFVKYIHQIMCEYFDGTWGGDKSKPFKYEEAQQKRFGLSNPESREDRKVPLQPYIIQGRHERYNQRKVTSLPHHLLVAGNTEALKRKVFFNLDWIYAKIKSSSTQALLQEIEFFMASDKRLKDDVVYDILHATLLLIRPYISKYPESLSYELSGRLAKYIDQHDMIKVLIHACDRSSVCPVVPLYTCFESAHLGLKQTLTTSQSEPWHAGGCICFSVDMSSLYSITYNEAGTAFLSTWDIETGSRNQTLQIPKSDDAAASETINSYFHCMPHSGGKHVIALYKKQYYVGGRHLERFMRNGFVDVIDISSGKVIRVIERNLTGRDYHNTVYFLKGDWISVRFGAKMDRFHVFNDIKHRHNRPHMLTNDCSKSLNKCSIRAPTKIHAGDEKTMVSSRTKCVHIKALESWDKTKGSNKQIIGELEDSGAAQGIAVTWDDKLAILGKMDGEINLYDITKTGEGKVIKKKKPMNVPRNERVKVVDTEQAESSSDDDSGSETDEIPQRKRDLLSLRLSIVVSFDNQFFVSVYQNSTEWEAFLWCLPRREFVARIASKIPLRHKYPMFSADSKYVVLNDDTQVRVYSCENGNMIRSYNVSGKIRDIDVDRRTNQVAVMLGREILFFELQEDRRTSSKKRTKQNIDEERDFLQREQLSNKVLTKASKICTTNNSISILEQPDPVAKITSNLLSVDGETKVALDVKCTPDGITAVELFSRIQVINTVSQEIQYTPLKGDTFFKCPPSEKESASPQDTSADYRIGVDLDDCSNLILPMCLEPGDKIVGANGRVRFRVPAPKQTKTPELQLMNIPSHVTSRSIVAGQVRQNFGIQVYNETIAEVSQQYLVTRKKKGSEEFLNVYGMERGHLLTTHAVPTGLTHVLLSVDDSRLITITKDLTLHQCSGQNLAQPQGKCQIIKQNNLEKSYDIHELVTFPKAPEVLIVRYADDRSGHKGGHIYKFLNVLSKQVSPAISTKMPFEDISSDGSRAIDAQLNMYDMEQGKVIRKISYSNTGINMRVQAKISEDKKYVVFVDKYDDTLHIAKETGQTYVPYASCKAHVPYLRPYGDFVIRQGGKIISLQNGWQLILLAIKGTDDGNMRLDYESELDRALKLVPSPSAISSVKPAAQQQITALTTPPTEPIATQEEHSAVVPPIKPPPTREESSDVVVEDFISSLKTADVDKAPGASSEKSTV